MKKIIVVLLIIPIFFLASCEKDEKRTSVIGTWQCVEVGTVSTPNPYFVDIAYDYNDTTRLILYNFYNIGYSSEIIAEYEGNKITLISQVVGGYSFVGEGVVSSNYKEIEWQYEVDDGSGMIDYVSAVYSRN
jgi:hypothetical protein